MASASDFRTFVYGTIIGRLGAVSIPKDADLTGKTVIITGANTGLGFEAAKHMYVILLFTKHHTLLLSVARAHES